MAPHSDHREGIERQKENHYCDVVTSRVEWPHVTELDRYSRQREPGTRKRMLGDVTERPAPIGGYLRPGRRRHRHAPAPEIPDHHAFPEPPSRRLALDGSIERPEREHGNEEHGEDADDRGDACPCSPCL